jgi:WD40 repeat protein
MRADSFLGQIVAVVSRRTPALRPYPCEPSTFPGWLTARHRVLLSAQKHRQGSSVALDQILYPPERASSRLTGMSRHSRFSWIHATTSMVILLTIFSTTVAVKAISLSDTAAYLRRTENAQHATAVSQQLAFESQIVSNAKLSALLAETAYRISPTSAATGAMLAAFTRENVVTLSLTSPIVALAVNSDGKILATASRNGSVRLWNLRTHKRVRLAIRGRTIDHVAFSPDSKVLATVSGEGVVRLWSVGTHRQLRPVITSEGTTHIAFSPGSKILALASTNGTVHLWNLATHQQCSIIRVANSVIAMAFNRRGKILALASTNGTVHLWNLATHQQTSLPQSGIAARVGFSPNGKLLATADPSGIVRLWRLASHRRIGSDIPGNGITHVAFSPDSKLLATASTDGTIRLWGVTTQQQIGPALTGDGITNIAFSSNGRILATASASHTVQVWALPSTVSPAKLSDAICERSSQLLTPAEWAHYAPGIPYHHSCSAP